MLRDIRSYAECVRVNTIKKATAAREQSLAAA